MSFVLVAAAAVGAGIVQTVTGFGAGIFLMLFLPFFFDMLAAPAVSSAICLTLSTSLAWQFRRKILWNVCLLPTLVYMAGSMWAIGMVKSMDMELLTLAFGVFLILLSIYFLLFSSRLTLRANRLTASICATISGVTSGLFGIGGPLMAIYFVSATEDKESYIGSIQFLFAATSVLNLFARILSRIYTIDLIPITILGFVGIMTGKKIGLYILNILDPDLMKKLVYFYVGISGVLTVLKQL